MAIESINQDFPKALTLRPGESVQVPVRSYPSTGYRPSVLTQGEVVTANLETPLSNALEPVDLTQLRIGGAVTHVLSIMGLCHGKSVVVVRFARPWIENDPGAVEMSIEVAVVKVEYPALDL